MPLPVLRRRRLRQCLQDHGCGLRPVYARLAIGPIAPLAPDNAASAVPTTNATCVAFPAAASPPDGPLTTAAAVRSPRE